jgi:hypothetical protein
MEREFGIFLLNPRLPIFSFRLCAFFPQGLKRSQTLPYRNIGQAIRCARFEVEKRALLRLNGLHSIVESAKTHCGIHDEGAFIQKLSFPLFFQIC